jgi:hypothetical protein
MQQTDKLGICFSESWLSGRKHTPAKGAYVKAYRGFESLTLRQNKEISKRRRISSVGRAAHL